LSILTLRQFIVHYGLHKYGLEIPVNNMAGETRPVILMYDFLHTYADRLQDSIVGILRRKFEKVADYWEPYPLDGKSL
jgi:hypothetical protein